MYLNSFKKIILKTNYIVIQLGMLNPYELNVNPEQMCLVTTSKSPFRYIIFIV